MAIFDNINSAEDLAWVTRAEEHAELAWTPAPGEWVVWAGLPLLLATIILGFGIFYPDVYATRFLPEGFGVLEVLHFALPLVAGVMCLALLFHASVRANRFIKVMTILFAVACIYIAGEEHSWGQHFFGWSTPDAWSAINRQQETNLHNTLGIFNHTPQKILEFAILIGGIILPLWQHFKGPFENWFLRLYVPSLALLPVALTALAFKVIKWTYSHNLLGFEIIARPSEALETFYYLFILLYVILYQRRIRALDATLQATTGGR